MPNISMSFIYYFYLYISAMKKMAVTDNKFETTNLHEKKNLFMKINFFQ